MCLCAAWHCALQSMCGCGDGRDTVLGTELWVCAHSCSPPRHQEEVTVLRSGAAGEMGSSGFTGGVWHGEALTVHAAIAE